MPGYQPVFKMRNLPKAEYLLLRELIKQFNLDDPSELVTCMLRLTYEILHMQDAQIHDGRAYLIQVINQYRSNPSEIREYEI